MIWHDCEVLPDDALRVGIEDRVFEHGLGLFETFRSWDGRAPLLPRHLARLRESAKALGIPLERVRLPGPGAVASLLGASDVGGDAMLRLTVTAGSASGVPPVAWMIARPLPPPEPNPLRVLTIELGQPDPSVHYHKMLNYWGRRKLHELALTRGAGEILITIGGEFLLEGSRNNVLIVPVGRPRVIATPSLTPWPLLGGIMRRVALDFAADRGYEIEERRVNQSELADAEAVFLTNSVRGVRPASSIDSRTIDAAPHEGLIRLFAEELPRFLRGLPVLDEPTP